METMGSITVPAAEVRREVTITTADGHELSANLYEPRGDARASVLIVPATATPQSYYAAFATHLADAGIRVLTFDYRGVGASRHGSLRGFEASMTVWAQRDAVAAFRRLRAVYPNDRVVLVGHSFGGQALGLAEELHAADAAILVASQLGWFGHWPALSRPRLAFYWHLAVPVLGRAFGYLPGWAGLSVDLPRGAALEWARWCSHPEYLMGHDERARERFAAFRAPTALFSFTDDDYAPEGATSALATALSSADIHHYRVTPQQLGVQRIGHFGFFRRGFEPSLWRAAVDFVSDVANGRAPRRAAWLESADARLEEADILRDLRSAPQMR